MGPVGTGDWGLGLGLDNFLAGSVFLSLKFQNEYYKSTLGNRPRNYDCYCKRKLALMKLFSFGGKENGKSVEAASLFGAPVTVPHLMLKLE